MKTKNDLVGVKTKNDLVGTRVGFGVVVLSLLI